MASPTILAGYLAFFVLVGGVFLAINLIVGMFVRPDEPSVEKREIYECGEPTIGSSFVQFDLRFYVVALLFIIFDVELAFFFPWANVFGTATHLMDPNLQTVRSVSASDGASVAELTPPAAAILRSFGLRDVEVPDAAASADENRRVIRETGRMLAKVSMFDIYFFFAVLVVGFAYVWRRGDLDWVRAVSTERARASRRGAPPIEEREPALAGR